MDDNKNSPELCGAPGEISWLESIIRRLLAPDGCPWDREQTLTSLRPFLLEEAYEVLDALDEGDKAHHTEELGDLLFQIVFQAALAGISLSEIIRGIGEKLIRRHPHVFGAATVRDSHEVLINWEKLKQDEHEKPRGLLDGVPRSMPALSRALHLTKKAAKVGFDWPDLPSVRAKVIEELAETDEAIAAGDQAAIDHELGDLLFALANWARKLSLDPEECLQHTNARFAQRFAYIEEKLAERGKSPAQSDLVEMDALWNEAKRALTAAGK